MLRLPPLNIQVVLFDLELLKKEHAYDGGIVGIAARVQGDYKGHKETLLISKESLYR